MKYLLGLLLVSCALSTYACGPTPQKLTKEIEIHASESDVKAVLSNPAMIQIWHPMVFKTTIKTAKGTKKPIRSLALNNHWTLSESIRDTSDGRYIEKTFMTSGTMPVTQLKSVMQILPSDKPNVTKLRWLGRFFNKANLLDAPKGQDNAAAIAAVTQFYEQGLSGLKAYLEKTHL